MTPVSPQIPSVQERMNAKLQFFKLCKKGIQSADTLQHHLDDRIQDVRNRIGTLTTPLEETEKAIEENLSKLINEGESTDFLRDVRQQSKNLQGTSQELKSTQEGLRGSLNTTQDQLLNQKKQKKDLEKSIKKLPARKTENSCLPFPSEIINAGARLLVHSLTN